MTEKQKTATTASTDLKENTAAPSGEEPTPTTPSDALAEQESLETLTAQLSEARAEARDNYDRFLRATAEMENHRKRAARQMEEFRKFANEAILKEFLTVVDNLERAIASAETSDTVAASLLDGVKMTHQETLKVLERFHVAPIEALGQPFDPNLHQAVMEEPSPGKPEHTVIRELARGYTLHERLLRPAMVVVSTGAGQDQRRNAADNES